MEIKQQRLLIRRLTTRKDNLKKRLKAFSKMIKKSKTGKNKTSFKSGSLNYFQVTEEILSSIKLVDKNVALINEELDFLFLESVKEDVPEDAKRIDINKYQAFTEGLLAGTESKFERLKKEYERKV